MKTTQHSVLITGGGSGIGFEIAKQFAQRGNQVIIVGRNETRLREAAGHLPGVTAIAADVTDERDVEQLVSRLRNEFPRLTLLVNNAGQAYVQNLASVGNVFAQAQAEMQTNYLATVRLTEKLLPLLKAQPEAAIVNVSSIVAFVPSLALPTYAASKAALRSYTQALRHALAATGVRVFELMPPLVDTAFSKEIGGHNGIAPAVVAQALVDGMHSDTYEIQIGITAQLYQLSLSSPADAFAALNGVQLPAQS